VELDSSHGELSRVQGLLSAGTSAASLASDKGSQVELDHVRGLLDGSQSQLVMMREQLADSQSSVDRMHADLEGSKADAARIQVEADRVAAERDALQAELDELRAQRSNDGDGRFMSRLRAGLRKDDEASEGLDLDANQNLSGEHDDDASNRQGLIGGAVAAAAAGGLVLNANDDATDAASHGADDSSAAEGASSDSVNEVVSAQTESTSQFAPYDGPDVTPDDIERIDGIGAKTAKALHAAGIKTFARLAKCSDLELRQATEAAGLNNTMNMETWAAQASFLASGDEVGFTNYVKRFLSGR
jgi:predicted flap endonuclease-1-like 5' DNA nuclease